MDTQITKEEMEKGERLPLSPMKAYKLQKDGSILYGAFLTLKDGRELGDVVKVVRPLEDENEFLNQMWGRVAHKIMREYAVIDKS